MMTCVGFLVWFSCTPAVAPQSDAARFCRVAAPITWSTADTADTKRQVKAHNARWTALCRSTPS